MWISNERSIISYTLRVVYDVRGVAEYLSGDLAVGVIDAATPVEGVILLEDLVVRSSPGHATLVVATSSAWTDEVARGQKPVAGCVAVVAEGSLTGAALDTVNGRVTAVHVPGHLSEVVYPKLTALIASDQAAEDRRVTNGIKVLTQIARRGGVVAVVAELAHRIDGLGGAARCARRGDHDGRRGQPPCPRRRRRRTRPTGSKFRHPGLQIHPVGQGEDVSAHLVIGARGSTSCSRDLASQVAALLDLLLHTADHPTTERLGLVMMSTLLRGGPDAKKLLRRWGVHVQLSTAFAVASRSRAIDAERLAIGWLDRLGAVHVLSAEKGRVVGFIGDERAVELTNLVEELATEAGMPLRMGLGSPARVERLAGLPPRPGRRSRSPSSIFVPSSGTGHWRRCSTSSTNSTRAQPPAWPLFWIRCATRPAGTCSPTCTLSRVYLSEHGAWGTTAARLQIHRQTLTARIRRAEALTGLSMSSPDDRAAAWLAIRALKSPASMPRA